MSDRRKAESAIFDAVEHLLRAEASVSDALGYIAAENYPGNAHLTAALQDHHAQLDRIRGRLQCYEVRS